MANYNCFTVAGGLLEDGVLQLQVLHDAAGPAEVKLVKYCVKLLEVEITSGQSSS